MEFTNTVRGATRPIEVENRLQAFDIVFDFYEYWRDQSILYLIKSGVFLRIHEGENS